MRKGLYQRIRALSLKWKLIFPFLLLAFCGTGSLTYVGLNSQQDLIRQEEQRELLALYRAFLNILEHKKQQALSIATLLAQNLEVRRLLAEGHRTALAAMLLPLYQELQRDYGVRHLHFHVPPGRSFLRLHRLEAYGDDLGHRRSIRDACEGGKGVGGVEHGLAGLGIRGVVPVLLNDKLVGSVEVGFPFDGELLANLKQHWGPDFTVYEVQETRILGPAATTLGEKHRLPAALRLSSLHWREPRTFVAPRELPDESILLGPIRAYSGDVAALVQIDLDRSAIKQRLVRNRNLMFLMGALGMALSFLLTWLVASVLTRPIVEIVKEAQDIAVGRRESVLEERPPDEIGTLTRALNSMLNSLQERRFKIEEYARTLEYKVQQRTADLVASEEKHRTLVESLPLIVYRLLDEGTTEFVNSFFSETLGYTPEEVVGNPRFWRERVCGAAEGLPGGILDTCWQGNPEFRQERPVRDKQGRLHTFIDRAMPAYDEHGRLRWIDGIMIDITEFRRLQQKALRTEEIRILGEISARFAHEIRNPLATAGGFARRLRDGLPEDDSHRKFADIIVAEVSKLENILRIILSTIQPISLSLVQVELNGLLRQGLAELGDDLARKHMQARVDLGEIPLIDGDEEWLSRAFSNLLKHSVLAAAEGSTLRVSTARQGSQVRVALSYATKRLADEDLEQFFLPRLTSEAGPEILEIPLSRIVLHRHGGKIEARADRASGKLQLDIELPVRALGSENGYIH